MPDDSLSPAEKAVVAFFEIIAFALGWAGVDRLLAGNSLLIVLPIFLACIVISYAGFKWPHVKSKISGRIASAIEDLAGSFRFRVSVFLVLSLIAVSYLLVFMHSLRSDLDDLNGRRTITETQKHKLQYYLSQHDASAVSIKVVQRDDEAMEYAGQLWSAMTKTNWDINPPNHSGPEYFRYKNTIKKPTLADVDSSGTPRFKTVADYMNAYDAWLHVEISDEIATRIPDQIGLCIDVQLTGQPTNPDPRHPTPQEILAEALRYADIGANCGSGAYDQDKYELSLVVGHKPRGQDRPILLKISRWIEEWAR